MMQKNKNNIKSNADKLREEFYEGMCKLKERQERTEKLIETLTAKTDAEIDKLLKAQEKTDEQIDKLLKAQEKTDEQMRETDERMKRTDAQIDKLLKAQEEIDKKLGDLTGGWGRFVEGLVRPSFKKLFKELDMEIVELYPEATAHMNGDTMEIDILAIAQVNKKEDIIILVEAKSNLDSNVVIKFEEKINDFFKFFPRYKGRKIIGVVAGIRMGEGVDKFAEKKGFYVLAPSGKTMVILNKEGFKPKIW